jgi:hypothetical protein
MMITRRTVGIALISMLMLIGFALALVAAFFKVETGANATMLGGSRQSARLQDLKTLHEFCTFQLEKDRHWGISGGPAANGNWPNVLSWNEVTSVGPEGQYDGNLEGSGNTFSIYVLNNLDTNNVGPQGIPGRMVRARIIVRDNALQSGAEIYLHKAPIYDCSLLASETILVESDIDIDSVDPIHNKIRAIEGFDFPGFQLTAPISIGFRGGSSIPSTPSEATGTVWSKQDIKLNGVSLTDAENATGGRFVDFAARDYIPKLLNFSDFKSSSTPVPSAKYDFGNGHFEYFDGAVWQSIDDSAGNPIEFGYMREEYPLALPGATQVHFNADALPTYISGSPIRLASSGEPAFEHPIVFSPYTGLNIDLSSATVNIPPSAQVDLSGDFAIRGTGGVMPTINFGTVGGTGGYWTASQSGILTVDGNLSIEGTISGQGSVIANGNIEIFPQSVELGTDVDTELAIFAQSNVVFRSSSLPTPPGAGPTTSIRGLVYSGGHVLFEGANDDLKIEGALVAPSGKIELRNLNKTHLIYNPNYLDVVTDKPGDTKVDLETVSWRDI